MMPIRFCLSAFIIIQGFSISAANEWLSYTNSNNIRQIVADSEAVWGATSGGVMIYSLSDGEITSLTNTDGLGGIDYLCAAIDSAGDFWFGAGEGQLTKLTQTGEIINYPFEEKIGEINRRLTVLDVAVDGDILWVATDIGVTKFSIIDNGGEIKDTAKELGELQFEEDVLSLAVIGDNVWAGTKQGLAFIDRTNPNIQFPGFWRSFTAPDFPNARARINTISAYYDTVVVGADSGLYKLQVQPDTSWVEFGSFSNLRVRKIIFDDGQLYVSTNAGVHLFDGNTWSILPTDGLPLSRAGDILIDNSGSLWGSTAGSGLANFDGMSWTLYSIPGPASNVINKMAIDSSGGLWMTHDGRGVSRFSNGTWTVYNSGNSDLEDNGAHSITVGGNGSVWVGSWGGGLYRFADSTWDHWNTDNSPMFGVAQDNSYWAATDVEYDDAGYVWVSSLDADSGLVMGAFYYPTSAWHLYFEGPNTISENTVEVLHSRGNSLWIGTTQGLHVLNHGGTPLAENDDTWINYVSREFITDMTFDRFGNLWFTSITGLFYVEDFDTVRVSLPLDIAGSVNSVASDGIGNIWVGTVGGAGVLKPDKVTWQTTYTAETSPLLNNNVTEIEIDIETGIVYLGTVGGLSVFDSGVEPPSDDLSDVEAYPNPVIASRDNSLSFKRVPADATVFIYTVAGDLVSSIKLNENPDWNLRNSRGEPVAGGIYIFVVEYQGKSGTGKFAIIK